MRKRVERLEKDMPAILRQAEKKLPFYVLGYIGAEMENAKVSQSYRSGDSDKAFDPKEETWRSGSRLRNKSGNLFKSYHPKNENSKSSVISNDSGIKAVFESGLRYAEVQEKGMFVKSKGKMHNYFWAMYAEHKNEFFKIMALSVLKKGGVDIPARPFFKPGMAAMKADGMKLFLKELMLLVEKHWKKADK